jgi:ribosome maturation factor RimP
MSTVDRVRQIVEPLVLQADLELYDLELSGGVLQVLVDKVGGADIDAISRVSRAISRALDEHDPIDGRYTLEVGTPGLERPLRTPHHFETAAAAGMTARVKTRPGVEGERRVEGAITAVDDSAVTIQPVDGRPRTVRFEDIERARTTFEWGGRAKQERKAKA